MKRQPWMTMLVSLWFLLAAVAVFLFPFALIIWEVKQQPYENIHK